MSNATWNARDWNCNRAQTWFSNSQWSGFEEGIQAQNNKSKGNPSHKSNSSDPATDMNYNGSAPAAHGNPLSPENYIQAWKWGNTYQSKWTILATRPDPFEKSYAYEGE